MCHCFSFVGVVLAALVLSFPLCAQEYRARVQGVVTNPSHGVVVGAVVTLINGETGVKKTQRTNESGHYLFDLIQPGTYTVEVEAAGFSKAVQQGVLVQSRASVTVDSVLRVGQTTESVTVQATAGTVDFASPKVEITLDRKLVADIPNFGRNPFLLATIDPTVERTRTEIRPQDSWGPNAITIAGSKEFSNDLQVDGSPITLTGC
jgi:hypothetical protein